MFGKGHVTWQVVLPGLARAHRDGVRGADAVKVAERCTGGTGDDEVDMLAETAGTQRRSRARRKRPCRRRCGSVIHYGIKRRFVFPLPTGSPQKYSPSRKIHARFSEERELSAKPA